MRNNLNDKITLITGATSGLGKELALLSAEDYTHLILIGRNSQALNDLKLQIQSFSQCEVSLFVTDYLSASSVKATATALLDQFQKIDVVIHNVGALHSQPQILENGIDRMYQINYLSHYILTESLLSGGCKINQMIFIGSSIKGGSLDFIHNQGNSFNIRKAYAGSKLAMNIYAAYLSEKYPEISVNCFQPGRLNTNIGAKSTHWAHSLYWKTMQIFASDTHPYAKMIVDFMHQNFEKKQSGFSFNKKWIPLNLLNSDKIQELLKWSEEMSSE